MPVYFSVCPFVVPVSIFPHLWCSAACQAHCMQGGPGFNVTQGTLWAPKGWLQVLIFGCSPDAGVVNIFEKFCFAFLLFLLCFALCAPLRE